MYLGVVGVELSALRKGRKAFQVSREEFGWKGNGGRVKKAKGNQTISPGDLTDFCVTQALKWIWVIRWQPWPVLYNMSDWALASVSQWLEHCPLD